MALSLCARTVAIEAQPGQIALLGKADTSSFQDDVPESAMEDFNLMKTAAMLKAQDLMVPGQTYFKARLLSSL